MSDSRHDPFPLKKLGSCGGAEGGGRGRASFSRGRNCPRVRSSRGDRTDLVGGGGEGGAGAGAVGGGGGGGRGGEGRRGEGRGGGRASSSAAATQQNNRLKMFENIFASRQGEPKRGHLGGELLRK